MSLTFKPGDLAEICNKPCRCCNGLQVIVVRGPEPIEHWLVPGLIARVAFGYEVRAVDGVRMFCELHQLRRIDPPADVHSDANPNALSKFDPALWTPSTELVS